MRGRRKGKNTQPASFVPPLEISPPPNAFLHAKNARGQATSIPEDKAKPFLEKAKYLIAVENNFTGQLANVIRRSTGIKVNGKILKYSGRPFSPEEIVANLKEEAKIHV